MAQNDRSEALSGRPARKRRQDNFSGRCSSGPKMASEWLKTTVLRPFPTALQGSATRVMFIKNRQRFTVSLPWASVLLVSKPSNLYTRGSIWASAGSAKRLQLGISSEASLKVCALKVEARCNANQSMWDRRKNLVNTPPKDIQNPAITKQLVRRDANRQRKAKIESR